MPRLTVHDLDVFYRDEGDGPPMVLGHSSTGSSGQWRELIAALSDRYRLLAPDHIGYGRTTDWRATMALMEHEIATVGAIVRLARRPVHLVGHSYGGSILARVAVRIPSQVNRVDPRGLYVERPDPGGAAVPPPGGEARNIRLPALCQRDPEPGNCGTLTPSDRNVVEETFRSFTPEIEQRSGISDTRYYDMSLFSSFMRAFETEECECLGTVVITGHGIPGGVELYYDPPRRPPETIGAGSPVENIITYPLVNVERGELIEHLNDMHWCRRCRIVFDTCYTAAIYQGYDFLRALRDVTCCTVEGTDGECGYMRHGLVWPFTHVEHFDDGDRRAIIGY